LAKIQVSIRKVQLKVSRIGMILASLPLYASEL